MSSRARGAEQRPSPSRASSFTELGHLRWGLVQARGDGPICVPGRSGVKRSLRRDVRSGSCRDVDGGHSAAPRRNLRSVRSRRPGCGASTGSGTVWLCRPGTTPDPCTYDEASTSVSASGATSVSPSPAPSSAAKRFDCFYVYPTVPPRRPTMRTLSSSERRSRLRSHRSRGSPRSATCGHPCTGRPPTMRWYTAWLPTGPSSTSPTPACSRPGALSRPRQRRAPYRLHRPLSGRSNADQAPTLAGRPVVEAPPATRVRHHPGRQRPGPVGRDVGGSFLHIPACRSASRTGCVIAYSTFPSTPPRLAVFGRPGQGVSLQSGQTARVGQRVLCVNPVRLSSGRGVAALFPHPDRAAEGRQGHDPWVTYPHLYTATCETAGNATWLQVDAASVPGDPRPTVTESLGPLWGYHVSDVNLALGNLVGDVAAQEASFR